MLTADRIFKGDKHVVIFYLLSKIHQRNALRDKTIEHYRKSLELWKDADPGIAEVEDAKKRVAGLKKQ